QLWQDEYDEPTIRQICDANNAIPETTIRDNTLKTSRDELYKTLTSEGIKVSSSPFFSEAMQVQEGNVQHTHAFQQGTFVIQDHSSMLPAHVLQVGRDMSVLDACAAPGGKTTHLSQLMQNTGQITAL